MIKRLSIVNLGDEEHYYVYYESGMCRFFDHVTNPIREFINREDVKREVIIHKGAIEWELTI